jgi:hypothetical protein
MDDYGYTYKWVWWLWSQISFWQIRFKRLFMIRIRI